MEKLKTFVYLLKIKEPINIYINNIFMKNNFKKILSSTFANLFKTTEISYLFLHIICYIIFGVSLWRKFSLTDVYSWQVEEYFNSLFR